MPIYEYECQNPKCGHVFEVYQSMRKAKAVKICPQCSTPRYGWTAKRIVSRFAHPHNDAGWIKSVTEVVDKDARDPATIEFRKDPTRANMQRWMEAKGLRHLEPGERPPKPDLDTIQIQKEVWEKHQKRNRIEIRSK